MHIKKYDHNYSRRVFLERVAKGSMAAGVLAPLWPLIGHSADITKAYPEELLSIEAYTKGKIKPGDMLTADNVEHVKDLLDPIAYHQVSQMGRRIEIVETTTDVTKMFPHDFMEATMRNHGRARMDETGKNFLAAAARTTDRDGNLGIGDPSCNMQQVLSRRICSDEIAVRYRFVNVLADEILEFVGRERLDNVVGCAVTHDIYRVLDSAVRRHENRREVRVVRTQMAE